MVSLRELDRLVGTAMADVKFRELLLNSHRQEILAAFDLTAEEKATLLGIESHTLQEFAQALYFWMKDKETVPFP